MNPDDGDWTTFDRPDERDDTAPSYLLVNTLFDGDPVLYRRFGRDWYAICVSGNAFGRRIPPDDHVNVVLMRHGRSGTSQGWSTVKVAHRLHDTGQIAAAKADMARHAIRHAIKQRLA